MMKWASAISEAVSLETAFEQISNTLVTQLEGLSPDLITVFICGYDNQNDPAIFDGLLRRFPGCLLLGSSAGGVIGGGREIEQKTAVAVTAAHLPEVQLIPFHLQNNQLLAIAAESADEQTKWEQLIGVSNAQKPHFLLLAEPFTFDAEPLLTALDRVFPESCKIGGLVSGASQAGEHMLFLGDQIYDSGLVGLAMHGNIAVSTVVAQGCRPIGEPLFVTEVEQNRILGLDGKTPLEVLQALYETLDSRDQKLLQHSLFLGMTMQESQFSYQQGDFLIRNILGIDSDNGALAVAANPRQNSVIQFHLRDAQTSADDLNTLLQPFQHISNEGAESERPAGSLLFSCLGRGVNLYGEPDHDSQVFQKYLGSTPLGGFFCNGEIGPVQGSTFVHGYTSAFGLFRAKSYD